MKYIFTILSIFSFALSGNAQWVTTVAGVLEVPGFNDGPALSSRFFNPHGIATDSLGNVYVADRYNHTIRKFDPITNTVSTFAGTAGQSGSIDGVGAAARFNEPWGICSTPGGVLYVADTKNNKIRRVKPNGTVSTIAGSGNYGTSNGPSLSATFGNPTGIEVDGVGNIYVADHLTHIIRKISTNNIVSTIAGTPYIPGNVDGQGSDAQFWRPYGLTLDNDGNILVADEWNHKIRKVTPSGQVTTLAGNGQVALVNGDVASASFNYPWDVTVDDNGNIYVADGYNYVIRKITPFGQVSSLAGKPQVSGGVDGEGSAASFSGATAVAWCSKSHSIYVGDAYNHLVRNISLDGEPIPTLNIFNLNGTTQLCEGDNLSLQAGPTGYDSYLFYVDGNLEQEGNQPNFQIDSLTAGQHIINAEAFYLGQTIVSNSFTFDITPLPQPNISVVGELTFYEGDSVILIANGSGDFLWSDAATTQTNTIFDSGTYFVEETVNGCTGKSELVVVEVIPLPNDVFLTVNGPTTLCPGESTELLSSAGGHNQWLKDGWFIDGATATSLRVEESGLYQVQVTDPNTGIINLSESVSVSVAPPNDIDFEAYPQQAVPGDEISFNTTGSTPLATYLWDFGDANGADNSSAEQRPVYVYEQEGFYSVSLVVTDTFGCAKTITKPNYISVFQNEVVIVPGLFIPSAFTPNGDGVNDLFKVRGAQGNVYMAIYNHWGEAIFVADNATKGWDGTRYGIPAQNGTYTYLVIVQTADGPQEIAGHITLLR